MLCPVCRHPKSEVFDTIKGTTLVSRVRYCVNCEHIWSTKEYADKDFSHKGYQKRAEEQQQKGIFDLGKDDGNE